MKIKAFLLLLYIENLKWSKFADLEPVVLVQYYFLELIYDYICTFILMLCIKFVAEKMQRSKTNKK
jgi:hypothetical protein